MEMIPLISGSKAGPLGIVHLPRLWLKVRMHGLGLLPEGYRYGNGGNDSALTALIGTGDATFYEYVTVERPDYLACEEWVRRTAPGLTAEAIAAFNHSQISMVMPEPRRSDWTARFGIEGTRYDSAVGLNQLDDWAGIHEQLLAPDQPATPVIPAISSDSVGPLGVPHLARLWLKHRLNGAGRLMDGYRHGEGGFDQALTDAIGLDRVAFATYVETEKPDYLTAETWVRDRATALNAETIGAWNARVSVAEMPEHMIAGRHADLGITDPALKRGVPLNDLDDWLGLHKQLLAAG